MVSQISLDCDLCLGPGSLGNKDGDSSVPSSSQEHAAPQMPVKKQTRQWAAWTRQEEESFFVALRQVGKNFEKITSRVQSKNKDQVRHYYYRLVRRMNKLLGPDLCLDAKNSKDTNAAMLRWWSLLEKYSCKASKLHLKPRRFKIFLETLENQLLKDRRKNIKKRLSTGENNASMPNIPTSNLVRPANLDNHSLKMVLVDSQNIQKHGTGKGAMFKRNVHVGTNRTNCKIDPASVKTVKTRRKAGLASAAAYKRWEKAAIAGVSLVADAAAHLERAKTDKENVQEPPGHDDNNLNGNETHSLQMSPQSMFNQNNSSTKLKLQLFPIDDCTRKALEMDHHNPYLELTLSTRKRISSILEHLNRKWRNSTCLTDELMLFPYWAKKENLVGYQKWAKDSPLCAADVYYLIGSPTIFRLRYGWFSKSDVESATARVLSDTSVSKHDLNITSAEGHNTEIENQQGPHNDCSVATDTNITMTPASALTSMMIVEFGVSVPSVNTSAFHGTSSPGEDVRDLSVTQKVEKTDVALMTQEWADNLTNISMGDLLSESTPDMEDRCTEFSSPLDSNCLEQIPFTCDSFDAAIVAHISKHQNKMLSQHAPSSHLSSLWDAEETRDAFAFQKSSAFCDANQNTTMSNFIEHGKQVCIAGPSALHPHPENTGLAAEENLPSSSCSPIDIPDDRSFDHLPENSNKDFSVLSNIYWPDSLGPLDLGINPCRDHNNDPILSDSLGGIIRLFADSLDTVQNCSLLEPDKSKPPASSTGESPKTPSFSDFKIGSEI